MIENKNHQSLGSVIWNPSSIDSSQQRYLVYIQNYNLFQND